MSLTNVSVLLLIAVAGVVGWNLGGSEGMGVWCGAMFAGGLTLLAHGYQRSTLEQQPHLAIGVLGVFMVVKMFALFAAAALLRYWPYAAERADWKAFVLAFAPVAIVALLVGAVDTMLRLKATQNSTAAAADAVPPTRPATLEG